MTKLIHIVLTTSALTALILATPLPNPVNPSTSIQDPTSSQAGDSAWGKSKRDSEGTLSVPAGDTPWGKNKRHSEGENSVPAGDTPWGKTKRHSEGEVSVAGDTPWGKLKRRSEGKLSVRIAGGPYQSHGAAPDGWSRNGKAKSKRAALYDPGFPVSGGPYNTHGGGEFGDLDVETAQAGDFPWGKAKRFVKAAQSKRDALVDDSGFQVSGGPYQTKGEGDSENEGWSGEAQRSRLRRDADEDDGDQVSTDGNPWQGRNAAWSGSLFRARSGTRLREKREDVGVNGGPYQTHGDVGGWPVKKTSVVEDAAGGEGPNSSDSMRWVRDDNVEGGPYNSERKRQDAGAETSGQHQTHRSIYDDGAVVSGGPYQGHGLKPEGIETLEGQL